MHGKDVVIVTELIMISHLYTYGNCQMYLFKNAENNSLLREFNSSLFCNMHVVVSTFSLGLQHALHELFDN